MTCQDIYDLALNLINENANHSDTSDLAARAPLLIWAICVELNDTNYWYCSQYSPANGLRAGDIPKITALTDKFPLHDRFASCVAYELGKLLMAEENVTLSNKLESMYVEQLLKIKSEIPAEISRIRDVYGGHV